jgi:secreted Zn-dependent insulinase-like peptidase
MVEVCREAFKQLRTVEQIGYIVTTYVNVASSVPHIVVLLQSTVLGAEQMAGRVQAFLQQWRKYLAVRTHYRPLV